MKREIDYSLDFRHMSYEELIKLEDYQLMQIYIKKIDPEFCKIINKKYSNIKGWAERLYLYVNHLNEPPLCPVCGKSLGFTTIRRGYKKYCCKKCSNIGNVDLIHQVKYEKYGDPGYTNYEQIKKTTKIHYGVEHPMQSEEVREKSKQTSKELYGVEYPMQTEKVREKHKQTCLKNHGVEYPMQSEEVREKQKQTCLKNHGVEYPMQSEEVREKSKQTSKELYGVEYPSQSPKVREKIKRTTKEHYGVEYYFCSDEWIGKSRTVQFFESKPEKIIQKFLIFLNLTFETHRKDLIKGFNKRWRELDIFIPSLNLAIEVNGMFYHSISNPNNSNKILGHYEKYIQCKEKGIELIYIWEDWIKDDIKLVEEFLFDKLNNNDLSKYKSAWFSDLNDSQWPLDLGWYKEPILNERVIPHLCQHGSFLCFDSGFLRID